MKSGKLQGSDHIEIRCPQCDWRLDGWKSVRHDNAPIAGDVTICVRCNTTLEFFNLLGSMNVKPISDEKLMGVDWDELAVAHKAVDEHPLSRKKNNLTVLKTGEYKRG